MALHRFRVSTARSLAPCRVGEEERTLGFRRVSLKCVSFLTEAEGKLQSKQAVQNVTRLNLLGAKRLHLKGSQLFSCLSSLEWKTLCENPRAHPVWCVCGRKGSLRIPHGQRSQFAWH